MNEMMMQALSGLGKVVRGSVQRGSQVQPHYRLESRASLRELRAIVGPKASIQAMNDGWFIWFVEELFESKGGLYNGLVQMVETSA